MKKLIPAIVMLLVSAVVLSTASYAWFSTSTSVTAEGMSVTASAPTSILIAAQTAANDGTWKEYGAIADFSDIYSTTQEKLSPVSSKDGLTFYVPSKCEDMSGSIEEGCAISTTTSGYLTFDYKLKNTNTEKSVDYCIESVTLKNTNIANAVRIAVLKKSGEGYVSLGVFAPEASTNENAVKFVTVGGASANGPMAAAHVGYNTADESVTEEVKSAWTAAAKGEDIDYLQYTNKIDTLAANSVEQEYRLVVWFEGQSAACISNNANLTEEISIVFGVILGSEK